MTLMYMLGGSGHGRIINVNDNAPAVYLPEPNPDFRQSFQPKRETYLVKKFATADDRWVTKVLVHESLSTDLISEQQMIGVIMDTWRASGGKQGSAD